MPIPITNPNNIITNSRFRSKFNLETLLESIKVFFLAIIAIALVALVIKVDFTKEKVIDVSEAQKLESKTASDDEEFDAVAANNARSIYYQKDQVRSLQLIANAMHPGKLQILNLGQPQCGENRTHSLIEKVELTSPNFPETFNAGTKCIWKIARPLGFQIKITFPIYKVRIVIHSVEKMKVQSLEYTLSFSVVIF